MSIKYIIKDLKDRGLIKQVTNTSIFSKSFSGNTLYCGFDPTAESLHIGHLILLLCLKRFLISGYKVIVLIGGATCLIGDPSFKTSCRKEIKNLDQVKIWSKKIEKQIIRLIGHDNLIILNNYSWLKSLNLLDFLSSFGKYFNISKMFNNDIIKKRLKNNNSISFTELSYNVLQGYDFYYLYKKHNIIIQIGGSDQWNNIIAGINLIKKICKKEVYGITLPLMLNKNGEKIGKTENNNTIWLDSEKTSPYGLYQFLLNISNEYVYTLIKYLTFFDLNLIEKIEKEDRILKNNKSEAQKILAEEVTRIVHGDKNLSSAKYLTNCLFSNNVSSLKQDDFVQIENSNYLTVIYLKKNTNKSIQDIITESKFSLSKKQIKNLIRSNAILINGKLQNCVNYQLKDSDLIYGKYTLVRKGKKQYFLIVWQN